MKNKKNENDSKKDSIVDESIFEKHVTDYVQGIGKMLTYVFLFLFLCDAIITILVYFGFFPFHRQSIFGGEASYKEFFLNQCVIQVFIIIPFIFFYALYKRSNFPRKKTLLCGLTLASTFFLCFGHWKNPYISFLFAVPVVITSPLDSKRHTVTVIIAECCVILYAFYQNLFGDPEINYLVLAVSTTTIVTFYLISKKIHNTMDNVFYEMQGYHDTQEILYKKIAHDVVTGAYSKSALEHDLEDLTKYKSLAFLDIDNFKGINDMRGHQTGDNFLKLLVMCLKGKHHSVYRYGGDEFVMLSKTKNALEMKNYIEMLSTKFYLASQELYGIGGTISVGVIDINYNESASSNIQRGDKMMYVAKNNGRNQVVIE